VINGRPRRPPKKTATSSTSRNVRSGEGVTIICLYLCSKEDEKALRQILAKMKGQADSVDAQGAKSQEAAERNALAKILGNDVDPKTVEALLKWKHEQHHQ
jgi:hypothetical protein